MSIDSVMSRMSQIQAMLSSQLGPAPAQPQTPPSSTFSSALATAQSGTGTGNAGPNTTFASLASTTPTTATAAATGTAATGASSLPAGTPYAAEITAAATANGVDPALLAGLVKQESGFNPNAGSGAGARGLTQLMPGTASGLGVKNILDPVENLNGGAKYLKQQLDAFGGDVAKALAAYNAGPGAVQRFGGIPPYAETQNYVRIVQQNAASLRGASAAAAPPSVTPYSSANQPSEI
jgi:soluble lytic murein transglycosylase-like protein